MLKAHCQNFYFQWPLKNYQGLTYCRLCICTIQGSTTSRTKCILDSAPCFFTPSLMNLVPSLALFFERDSMSTDVTFFPCLNALVSRFRCSTNKNSKLENLKIIYLYPLAMFSKELKNMKLLRFLYV